MNTIITLSKMSLLSKVFCGGISLKWNNQEGTLTKL